MEYIENADVRYIKCSNEGRLTYTQELNILEHLLNKLNPMSKSEYAKKQGISIAGVNDRIERSKIMSLKIIGRTFIFENNL